MKLNRQRIQILVTLFALIAVFTHILFPVLKIDAITVTLIIVSVVPWLAPLFKSVELPGGIKMEFQELEQVTIAAKKAGIIQQEPEDRQPILQREKYAFVEIAPINQELALVGLRIEVEKRLRKLAEKYDLKIQLGNHRMIEQLGEKQVLSAEERAVFRRMLDTLNHAAHGIAYDPRNVDWIMETGPQILAGLDAKLELRGGRFSVGRSDELPHWIDASFENCGGNTNFERKQCIGEHLALWETELINIYNALYNKLSPEQQALLASSQTGWRTYIEQEQSLINSFDNLRLRVGTGGEHNIRMHYMEKVKDKTLELEEILNYFSVPLASTLDETKN
ncbi:lysozyme inhibitor LprI family protein [Mucilaginibacter sp.]|uniref:lysozyme inhibitor LprI family protein n=1 Tax=Mucilaginibacter sp. TaxID=1882438 RepID=UPI00262B041F|nr:lysozyme inhibitor LprI family protein [Mucilaginibacter sp.]MDB5032195.1 hypothetical protein [Mucilaginibacter sp.]